jgi:hypothetical protein
LRAYLGSASVIGAGYGQIAALREFKGGYG